MKNLAFLVIGVLTVLMLLPVVSPCAPQVPITFPGDNEKTITRRAQWIEGAKKEKTLVFWSNLAAPEGGKLVGEFNKVYPFIAVTPWYAKSDEMDLKTEGEFVAGRNSVDVRMGVKQENLPKFRKMGMLERFTDIIPQAEKLPKEVMSQKYGDWAQSGLSASVPMYNTKLVSAAEAPKNWGDLIDPKWKGKIGVATDSEIWGMLAMSDKGWGMDKTINFLTKLKQQNPIWAPGHTAGINLLVTGEFSFLAGAMLYKCFDLMDKGAPINWVRANPVPVAGGAWDMMKKAPHPNAARLFIEWIFSPSGLDVFEAAVGKGMIYPGARGRQAKALEGLNVIIRDEDLQLKANEANVDKKFGDVLGVTMR